MDKNFIQKAPKLVDGRKKQNKPKIIQPKIVKPKVSMKTTSKNKNEKKLMKLTPELVIPEVKDGDGSSYEGARLNNMKHG